jgi:UDP-N-acetylglucosamine acyltransferase
VNGRTPPHWGADMSSRPIRRIHPTAVIAREVELAPDVEVGACAVIEGKITIGPGCAIRPGAYLFGQIRMGRNNVVYSGAVLGEQPQHLRYRGEPTSLEVGDGNTFREHVTVHRGTTHSMKTVIGNHNFLMAGSHVAHDCVIGNRCIITNGALIAGHCIIEDSVILSGNSALHQFCRVGRLALLSGVSASGKDIPPFIIQQGIDTVCGVNVIGMKRNGMSAEQIDAVKHAFRILYRDGLLLTGALERLEREMGESDVVQEMVRFLRSSTRGISHMRSRFREDAA